jgi:hypothetical protein
MLAKINQIFICKYPFQENNKSHYLVAISLGIWVFAFLWFTEPFELSDFNFYEKTKTIPLYGFFSALSYTLALFVQNYLHKKHKNWILFYEIIFLCISLTIASVFMYIIYHYGLENYNKEYTYFIYLKLIYTPSLVIILPFIVIARLIVAKNLAQKESIENSKDVKVNNKILISGEGKGDVFQIEKEKLVFIKSDNNYLEINYFDENCIKQKCIRGKLKHIKNTFHFLIQPHRSYLVNPVFFISLKKQQQKLYIELIGNNLIPISRNKIAEIKKQLHFTPKTNHFTPK